MSFFGFFGSVNYAIIVIRRNQADAIIYQIEIIFLHSNRKPCDIFCQVSFSLLMKSLCIITHSEFQYTRGRTLEYLFFFIQ